MRKEKLEELHSYLEELKTIERVKKEPKSSFFTRFFQPKPGFLTSEVYECHLNCGRIIVRERLLKGKKDGSAAIIFALTKSKEVILNVEPRVSTKETVSLGFPAGYIEQGESKEEGARRELLEEHGYIASEMVLLDEFYQDEGCSSAYNQIFLALDCEKVAEQKLDEDEIVRTFLCQYDEMLELNQLGYFTSSNSKLTIERAKEYLKRR